MKLRRVRQQAHETLEETYRALGTESGPFWAESATMMLELIKTLESGDIANGYWASTSHQYLVLHRNPTVVEPSVLVSAWAGTYKIEYELPAALAPWPHARVVGHTQSPTEACTMIAAALSRVYPARAEADS